MKWYTNLRISSKLISAFVVLALVAGAMGLYGITSMKKVANEYDGLWVNYGIALGDLGSAGIDFNKSRVILLRILVSDNRETMIKYQNEIAELDVRINENLVKFRDSIQVEEVKQVFEQFQAKVNSFEEIRDSLINQALAGQQEEAQAKLAAEGTPLADEAEVLMNELFDLRKENGSKMSTTLIAQTGTTSTTMIIVVALVMLLSISFGFIISRMISNPVKKIVDSANRIADGDLDVDIDIYSKDEVGQLAHAFRIMTNNLNDTMRNIQTAAEQVASGSKQISISSISLSQGATEQASSVEELTTSIEEIATQTKQNANTSNEANKLAEAAKDNAIHGSNQMKDMLNAMDEINMASQNISKIIKVIDEIAFQTNILALNAAVEAARAGQHGKGFAVVAEEVRNLAARSADAAKETTEMIEGSIKKAEFGTKIANDTAHALQNIVNDVAKVAELIEDIAASSNEQAVGINQINQGIMQVSQVVQANSATSEEAAAASEQLSSQASLLNEQVSRFKLRNLSYSTQQGMDGLSPELIQLFEKMSQKKEKEHPEHEASGKAETSKIVLSDNEFGKY